MKVGINDIQKIVVAAMVLLLASVTSRGVVLAGEKRFYAAPSIYRWILSEFKLSQDGGGSWTANLLTRDSVDFASVGIREKAGEFISHTTLACGHYDRVKYTVSGVTGKGVVAVDPHQWGGTWENSKTGVRYYYTDAAYQSDRYKDSLAEAEAAAEEMGPSAVVDPIREGACGIDISAGGAITLKYWLGCWLIYIAYYGDDNKFTYGSWCFRDSIKLEF